jgi:hypothetical protein
MLASLPIGSERCKMSGLVYMVSLCAVYSDRDSRRGTALNAVASPVVYM